MVDITSSEITGEILVQGYTLKELGKRFDDHEARLRSLERWRWIAVGAMGVLSGLISAGFSIILANLKH